ncbi:MAG: serine/threonine protein kinase [Muribaculaceae bacterium]|nr:serine/threonine protein kinase [Muribaculaceae bacterium]
MSELHKGQLFHNRYILVRALGQGASAEVWMARDTRANNLLVALKIFSQNSGMDSSGMQDFEREFTTVYNMKHSNLLPPTGYDICNGRPYLVMQYCENGSCNGMAGRMEEEDIIKFLHDVSAGLEYLHDHNIIHQDIKPDNILLDDNCNFMVTDFGISVNSDGGLFNSNGMSGGTRAYMGPERFEGITNSASDMWSLGATAVELLTGNPPYGDHGGLLQAEGEPLPELPKLQPEVKDMIMSCLAKDPAKRIKANEIRQKIDLYQETGSWEKNSQKKIIAIVATGVISVLMCLGIFLWDYNRTKVYYYKDYAEFWGVPHGIGRLSSNEMAHRELSYRFEYNKHKLRRVSLVNSKGKVIDHTDTELKNSRYADVQYFYTDNGNIDYTFISDPNGRVLFKMDYDDNLKTATFRQNDEYGTEMNLYANTNVLYKYGFSAMDEKSRISRYLLTYDEDGLLKERRYVGLQNVPACDKDNIYGSRYKYDHKGRKIEEAYIGADGNITSNSDGMAIRRYTYDDNDNWDSVTYLNSDGEGSHDGNNCSVVRIGYDDYGNRISEMYYTLEGEPSIRTDCKAAGFRYEIDNEGNRTGQIYLGVDGNPTYSDAGIVKVSDRHDENGFIVERTFLDENGSPTLYSKDGETYGKIIYKVGETGLPLEISIYDEYGNPTEDDKGGFKYVSTYDANGNITSQKTFDKDESPTLSNGFYHECRWEYDEHNNLIKESYFDIEGNPTTCDGRISTFGMEYNRQGAMTKMSYLGKDGRPISGDALYSGYVIEYDELGNQKTFQYVDTQNKPTMSSYGYSKIEYVYDPKTNFLTEIKDYNTTGRLVYDIHRKFDSRGNIVEAYTLVDGKLKPGSAVEHSEYDANNRETSQWVSDLSGKKINYPGKAYSLVRHEYDHMGNCISSTYWKADGTPGTDEQKSHRRVRTFDAMNRVISELNYGVDGKPLSGSNVNPEGRVKYDQWGNMAEISCYDGYGNPRLSSDGFFASRAVYDRRGNVLKQEFVGVDGNPVCSKNNGYAKAEHTYDQHGNQLESKYYDTTKCIRVEQFKYNDKNRLTEQRVCDANGKLTDQFYGVSRVKIDYDEDDTTPKKRSYYTQTGAVLGSQTWNKTKGEWNDIR